MMGVAGDPPAPASMTVLEFLAFFTNRYRQFGSQSHPPVHDPCAVARIAHPDLVECIDAFVAVETEGRWTSGMTVTDFRTQPGRPFNAKVATHLDLEGFWDLAITPRPHRQRGGGRSATDVVAALTTPARACEDRPARRRSNGLT